MKLGANHEMLAQSFFSCDETFVYAPDNLKWDIDEIKGQTKNIIHVIHNFDDLVNEVIKASPYGSSILVMSNGDFNGIHQKLLDKLKDRE